MDKLKECPFCGSDKIAECSTTDEELGATMHVIRCADCCSHSGYYSTRQEAVENWNRRAPSAVEDELRAVLTRALEKGIDEQWLNMARALRAKK
jgi:Lar family restriction alleviation protein